MVRTLLVVLALAVVLALSVASTGLLSAHSHSNSASPASSTFLQEEKGVDGCGSGNASICRPSSGVYLVIIGTLSCPHCRAMKDFLPSLGIGTYFCEIARKGSVCAKAFMELFESGIAPGVPVIVACSNLTKSILFIEVGEYRSQTWWSSVLSKPPSEPRVYIAGKPKTTLDPVLAEKLSKLICINATAAATPIPPRR